MAIALTDSEMKARLAKKLGGPGATGNWSQDFTPILGNNASPPNYQSARTPEMAAATLPPIVGMTPSGQPVSAPPKAAAGTQQQPGTAGLLSPTPLTDIQQNHAAIAAKMAGGTGGGDPLSSIRPTSSDPAVQAKINENLMREQLRQAGIAKRSALSSPVYAPGSPEQTARLAAITGAQRQESTLQQAMSHPQATMNDDAATRAKLIGSHEDLGMQGQRVADQMLQAALAKSKAAAASGVPGAVQAAQKEIDDAVAAGAGLAQKFGPGTLTGDEVAKRIISANQFAEKQRIAKEAALANVNADWANQAPIVAAGRDAALKSAQLPGAALGTKLAELELRKKEYGASGNEDVLKAQAMANVNRAKTEAAITGVEANKAVNAANYENRVGPLADPEYVKATARLSSTLAKLGAGGYLGSDRAGEVDQFENDANAVQSYIEGLPPDQKAAAKRDLAATLNTSGIGNESTSVLGGIGGLLDSIPSGSNSPMNKRYMNNQRWRKATAALRQYANQ